MSRDNASGTCQAACRLMGLVVAIILAIEACLMAVVPLVFPGGGFLQGVLDVGVLALLSLLAIWLLVLRPLQRAVDQTVLDRGKAERMLSEQALLAGMSTDVANALSQAEDLRGMLEGCAEVLVARLDAAFARIWTLNEAENMLELQASAGMYTHIDGGHARIPVGQFKIGLIAKERRAHLTNAVVGDLLVGDQAWAQREGMVSFAGYPLLVGGRLKGVMALFARRPLSEATLGAMATLADAIAIWIHRREAEQAAQAYAISLESANQALELARASAEATSQAKSDFLANMSHELRTPLHGVIGMTELLLSTNLADRQRRYAAMAKTSGESLIVLINDILDISKIEAGKLEVEHIEFNLRDVVDNVAASMAVKAESKGLEMAATVHPDVPSRAQGDPKRLQQVLLNLINNAIKFTQRGEVVVRVTLDRHDGQLVTLRFTVTDTGIGIPSDRIDRLFQSFSQVDASTTRQYGGTGLGLAISKRLVQLMQGQIGVDSILGEGSTFWFTVELEKSAGACGPPSIGLADTPSVRILAVDDNATNREIIHAHLTTLGFDNETAVDAEDALAQLRRGVASERPFGLAILDMQMPGMNGARLAQIIKADPALKNVVLMLLASALDGMGSDQLRAGGFARWLMKPVWRSALGESILGALTSACRHPACPCTEEHAEPVAMQPSGVAGAAGSRILLAEDNEIGREVAVELLSRAGYRCDAVVDGQRAVDAALSQAYDAILMDCQMPVMGGLDATRAIRQYEREHGMPHRIPIIALTANAIKGDQERCLEAGMDDYLTKPLNPDLLMEALQRHLSTTEAPANTPPRPPEPCSAPPFDPEASLKRWGMDADFVARIIDSFVTRIPDDLARLQRSLADENAEEFANLAHGLKGAAAYVGADRCHELAARAEENGRNGTLNDAEAALIDLQAELQRCTEYAAEQARRQEASCENSGSRSRARG